MAGAAIPQPAQSQDAEACADQSIDCGKKKKNFDLLVAPVPMASPETGAGLGVGAIVFYNPNHEPQQWISGIGVLATTLGTKGVGVFHSMSLGQDRIRIRVLAAYAQIKDKFYGIGPDAGDAGHLVKLDNEGVQLQLQGLFRVIEHGYAGFRYKLKTNNIDQGVTSDVVAIPPPDQLSSTLSAVGPVLVYDTRDNSLRPRRGTFASASWLFGAKALGDNFKHNKLDLAVNRYWSTEPGTVFAMRATMCAADGDVPFYDLCLFGSNGDLRGYTIGRYRDRASWSLQAEVRKHITGRWGAVGFLGLGGIAPSAGDIFDDSNLLPAGGVGVRYQPFRDNDVNIRLDFGLGKNERGVYLGLAEVF
jgi:hypothetical protein